MKKKTNNAYKSISVRGATLRELQRFRSRIRREVGVEPTWDEAMGMLLDRYRRTEKARRGR